MPNEGVSDPGHRASTTADLAGAAGPGSVDGATFSWSARGLALDWPWPVASPWAATG